MFQSTFPQGERRVPRIRARFLICFNPRSRKGNDIVVRRSQLSFYCFNPRSRKGNDFWLFICVICTQMFQSTFPQGERRQPAYIRGLSHCFNPRSRKGNDQCLSRICKPYTCFNPRSRKGNDIVRLSSSYVIVMFQSTFPQGERQQSSINFLYISCYYLCNYTNIIPVMQAQLTILISLYLNITVRISQTLYAHFCFAPIRYFIAALFNITKTTITLCS